MAPTQAPKSIIVELCRQFYGTGWATGTGGGVSIREGGRIYMAPSGVQKERLVEDDIYVLDESGETVLSGPVGNYKPSECGPLFMNAFRLRDAGAVIHSHGMYALLATLLPQRNPGEFVCTELEMIKGIAGHGYYDRLVVPIIENTARECDLADRMAAAMQAYPASSAVLVRRHGVYIWGRDWQHAKTQAECYHYLFEASVRMAQLGFDASVGTLAGTQGQPGDAPSNRTHGGAVGRREMKAHWLEQDGSMSGGAAISGTAPALRGGAAISGTAPALRGGAAISGTAPALRGGAAIGIEELGRNDVYYTQLGTDESSYAVPIAKLKQERGYIEQDIVEFAPTTPNLETICAKFVDEHYHDEDEVRFVLEGEGIFDIRSRDDRWMRVIVECGDLIVVPKDRHHRFMLTEHKTIRCVRLFQDKSGWTPHYRQ